MFLNTGAVPLPRVVGSTAMTGAPDHHRRRRRVARRAPTYSTTLRPFVAARLPRPFWAAAPEVCQLLARGGAGRRLTPKVAVMMADRAAGDTAALVAAGGLPALAAAASRPGDGAELAARVLLTHSHAALARYGGRDAAAAARAVAEAAAAAGHAKLAAQVAVLYWAIESGAHAF